MPIYYFENAAVEFVKLSRKRGGKEWHAEFCAAWKDTLGRENKVDLKISHKRVQTLLFSDTKTFFEAAQKNRDSERVARLEANRRHLRSALSELIQKNMPG